MRKGFETYALIILVLILIVFAGLFFKLNYGEKDKQNRGTELSDRFGENGTFVQEGCKRVRNNLTFSIDYLNPKLGEIDDDYYHYDVAVTNEEDRELNLTIKLIVNPKIAGKCIEESETSSPFVPLVVKPYYTIRQRFLVMKIDDIEKDAACASVEVGQDKFRLEC
ncbi:hypothetical protein CMI45_02250 [Candidatus Pacearchaeota archaeon]|nr:hypothetical protein [Candidatus Pacearchaeota archaeon]|tara:strand:- start:750 stop:1247 length:498 start_codon:yes stop_codon:yes gene_type:complete